jgi:hydroxymethylbilane synthase
MPRLRLASRGSRLALVQATLAAEALRAAAPGLEVEVVEVRTEGDERSEPLEVLGGRGVFTKEVDEAVLAGRADLAVHSCKDLPTLVHDELALAGLLPRGPAHDVLIGAASVEALPPKARVGTGSPRRAALPGVYP